MKVLLLALLIFAACTTVTNEIPELAFESIPKSLEAKKLEAQDLAIRVFAHPACRQRFVGLPDFPPGVIRDDLIWDYVITLDKTLATTVNNGSFHFTAVPVSTAESMTVQDLAIVYLHEAFHKADWSSVDFDNRGSVFAAEARAVIASNKCMESYLGQPLDSWVPRGGERYGQ